MKAKTEYSCAELGVCQRRQPACPGCTAHNYPKPMLLAPGVIDEGAARFILPVKPLTALNIVLTIVLVCTLAGMYAAKLRL